MKFRFLTLLATLGWILRPASAQTFIGDPAAVPTGLCGNASLNGSYAVRLSGRQLGSTGTFTRVFQGVGKATFDGQSQVTMTLNGNSLVAPFQTVYTGTYTIPANCSGTITITVGDSATYYVEVFDQGKNFSLTGSNDTYTFSGNGGVQPASCQTSTLSGIWTFSAIGFSTLSQAVTGMVEVSGLLQFDGQGNLVANWNAATITGIAAVNSTGTYSLAPDCTGTATLQDANNNSYTLSIAVSNAAVTVIDLNAAGPQSLFSGSGNTE